MVEKYYYLTVERILNVFLSIGAYVLLGIWLFRTFDGSTLQPFVGGAYAYLCLTGVYFFIKICSAYPYPEFCEGDFNLDNIFSQEGFDKDNNSLGICTGAYFSEHGIRLMVGGHLYDVEDVYFCDDENEEGGEFIDE
jgi:hypothetical protein